MKVLYLGILFTLLGVMNQAEARSVYLRSQVGQPWGVSTNEAAMDRVFWSRQLG